MNRFSRIAAILVIIFSAAFVSCALPAAARATGNDTAVTAAESPAGTTASIEVLRVGRIPYLDPRKMVNIYEPMMEYLKKEVGAKEVRLVLTPDYNTLTRFMKENKIDIAWHGTFAYPKARRESGGRAVLMPIWSGKPTYKGAIMVRADSGINSVAQLKGKSFAFTEKSSASGYFLPKIFLLENGIDPEKDFSRVEYIKKHDNILYNVLYKKFDAGAVYDEATSLMKTDAERKQLKVLAYTSDILNEPIMVRKDLPEPLVEKIVAAFMKLDQKNADSAAILNSIGRITGFQKVTDADYDSVVELVEKKYNNMFSEDGTAEASLAQPAPAGTATVESQLRK